MEITGPGIALTVLGSLIGIYIIWYVIFRIKKVSFLSKRIAEYNGEKVLFQDMFRSGFGKLISEQFLILTSKKIYLICLNTLIPRSQTFLIFDDLKIKFKQKILPVNWKFDLVYNVWINKKHLFLYKNSLEIFLERLKKIKPSTITEGSF